MARPKSKDGPVRPQPHLWSVSWGEELDAEIDKRNQDNVRNGFDDSKSGTAKYLVRQGIRYLDAAERDPSIRERVEAIYAQVLAEAAQKAEADSYVVGSEPERKSHGPAKEGGAKKAR
jgi:hypothetical protein